MQGWIDWLNHPLIVALGNSLSVAEVFGFVTGLWAVWLTARGSIWNFPIGIANCALLLWLFFASRLFADASLQVMFIILNVIGWWFWATGGKAARSGMALPVRAAGAGERVAIVLACLALIGILYAGLTAIKGSIPVFDATITALSVVAQWLLNRKILENWIIWILTDVISVPVYLYKDLYLIAILYVLFLILACRGYQLWRRELTIRQGMAAAQPALAA
jgi:nicotinamide mononucleotide transporter